MGKMFLVDTLFGNSRSWKRSQGQVPKNYFKFFYCKFGILDKFPLRIWFCDPYGTCRFCVTGILVMAVEPKISRFDIFSRSISRKILYQMTLNCMDHLF